MTRIDSIVVALASLARLATAQGDPCCSKSAPSARVIDVAFLFLDRETCTRCQDTESTLDAAVSLVAPVFQEAGVRIVLRKIHVQTVEAATQLRFDLSPTIRIDGRDIAPERSRARCAECGDLGSCDVACRVWTWRGRESVDPPKGLLVLALLNAFAGGDAPAPRASASPFRLPRDMDLFLTRVRTQPAAAPRAGKENCGDEPAACCEKPAAIQPCCEKPAAIQRCCAPGDQSCETRPGQVDGTAGTSRAEATRPAPEKECCDAGTGSKKR